MGCKVAGIMTLDVVATMISFFLGLWFRADFAFENIRDVHLTGYLSAIGPWCAITVVVFACFRLYSSGKYKRAVLFRYGSSQICLDDVF